MSATDGEAVWLRDSDGEANLSLALLGDGFEDDRGAFLGACESIAEHLDSVPPFHGSPDTLDIVAVWRPSPERGISDPTTGILKTTLYGSRHDHAPMERVVLVDKLEVARVAALHLPLYDAALVVVDGARRAGAHLHDQIATVSVSSGDFPEVALHELSHAMFALGDEYDTYGSNKAGGDTYTGGTLRRNLSRYDDGRDWEDLVNTTELPTMSHAPAPCSQSGMNRPLQLPATPATVGAFEGGGYYRCGVWRSQYACLMRRGGPLCARCQQIAEARF